MKTIKLVIIAIMLITSTVAFAERVVETEDIDSFIEDDNPASTSTPAATTTPAATAPSRTDDPIIKHKIFSLGLGFNFGIFIGDDISDVNNQIYNDFNLGITDYINLGEAEIYLNLVPRFTINIMPVRYFLIQLAGEVAWAPKVITTIWDTKTYHYMRYSPGIVLNGYIPLDKRRKYFLFLGGGAFYHFLEFESFTADGFGGRGQFGFRVDWKSTALEVFIAYDYARAETGQYNTYLDREMVLDYSSILIGINFYFKII